VAKDDPNDLFDPSMSDASNDSRGANIQRSGTPGNYSYSVANDWFNRPVNYVNFWDAARFANWLHNGQPSGAQGSATTEGGAYHNIGNQELFGRSPGARYFIPSEDEWYKAAFHDKVAGLMEKYYLYPTADDVSPGNDVSEGIMPGNNANQFVEDRPGTGKTTIGPPYFRTEVGEFELSDSTYGTFDQAGNVWEWNESVIFSDDIDFIPNRGFRGGSAFDPSFFGFPAASYRGRTDPEYGGDIAGFRIAGIVPEPEALSLLIIGIAVVTASPRRNTRVSITEQN
jgi:formylglycine-generating enzyme